jgi:hypothetical protein
MKVTAVHIGCAVMMNMIADPWMRMPGQTWAAAAAIVVAMSVVTLAITAERIAPKPQIVARIGGVVAVVAGAVISYA